MKLICSSLVAGLSLIMSTTTIEAQVARSPQRRIQPYATLALGPGIAQTRARERGNKSGPANPVLDATIGARKLLSGKLGVVVAANAGKNFDAVLGGEDASCRMQITNETSRGCLPSVPLLDWFGVSVGGEMHVGRAILGVQAGPASFGTRSYERDPTTGAKSGRVFGTRSQFDANFALARQLGITLSAVHRNVPSILNDRMNMNSITAGLTFQPSR